MSIRVLSILCFAVSLQAQITFEQLRDAPQANGNWPTYSGDYSSKRYSKLSQISQSNVKHLTLADEIVVTHRRNDPFYGSPLADIVARFRPRRLTK